MFPSKTRPSVEILDDPRIERLRGRPRPDEARDWPERRTAARMERQAAWAEMRKILGPVVARATVLQFPGGRTIGPARSDGQILRWTLWAPARRLLIDRHRRYPLPPTAELEDRRDFARRNGLEYAVVMPGEPMTPRLLGDLVQRLEDKRAPAGA